MMLTMMLTIIQSGTPDTVSYMILGYALIGGVGLIYVISLLLRQRNLQRDLDVMVSLREDDASDS